MLVLRSDVRKADPNKHQHSLFLLYVSFVLVSLACSWHIQTITAIVRFYVSNSRTKVGRHLLYYSFKQSFLIREVCVEGLLCAGAAVGAEMQR